MRRIENMAAQGDVLFVRVENIPKDAKLQPDTAEYIVAHSETGHHHVAKPPAGGSLRFYETKDPLTAYLEFRGGPVAVTHRRSYDTHETVQLLDRAEKAKGRIEKALKDNEVNHFKVIRQRQHTPEGLARVVD